MTQAVFSDRSDVISSLLPNGFHRLTENNPMTSNGYLPESVRLPPLNPLIDNSYQNIFNLAYPLFPLMKQLFQAAPSSPRRPNHASQDVFAQPLTNCRPLAKPIEVEDAGVLVYSIIEWEKVMGFNVWGEVRLCLPHLLRFVLHDMDIEVIGQAITKFKIACTKCSPQQLALLHSCSALPDEVTSCGLIRKSDAERMLKFLRKGEKRPTLAEVHQEKVAPSPSTERCSPSHQSTESTEVAPENSENIGNCIDVRHDCFGRQCGSVYPDLYISTTAACILCHSCSQLFSPPDFVGHTHAVAELDSCCHWGFDSTNWRSYLRLDMHDDSSKCQVRKPPSDNTEIDSYQVLMDFKVKFLKPLSLPGEILNKFDKVPRPSTVSSQSTLRLVDAPLDCRTAKASQVVPSSADLTLQERQISSTRSDSQPKLANTSNPASVNHSTYSACVPSSLEVRLRPNLTVRRLWAPHEGHLRIPTPPKLISECPKGSKPSNLSTDAPVLLDPARVVSKDAAYLYDRDFIPNVCLKPVSTIVHLSKSLLSFPSNDDISVDKRQSASAEDICLTKPMSSTDRGAHHRSRRTSSNSTKYSFLPLGAAGAASTSSPRLDSVDGSPARSRHLSCAQELLTQSDSAHDFLRPSLSSLYLSKFKLSTDKVDNLHTFGDHGDDVASTKVPRSPSVDFPTTTTSGYLKLNQHSRLTRTASNPELNSSSVLQAGICASSLKRSRMDYLLNRQGRSWSPKHSLAASSSTSSCTSPSQSKHSRHQPDLNPFTSEERSSIDQPNPLKKNLAADINSPCNKLDVQNPAAIAASLSSLVSAQQRCATEFPCLSYDGLFNLQICPDFNSRIPNLVSHWMNAIEQVNEFAGAVDPSRTRFTDAETIKASFNMELKKLFSSLRVIQERHFADLSAVLEENKNLKKLLNDMLTLPTASNSLTPNVLISPSGKASGLFGFNQPAPAVTAASSFPCSSATATSSLSNFSFNPRSTNNHVQNHSQNSVESQQKPDKTKLAWIPGDRPANRRVTERPTRILPLELINSGVDAGLTPGCTTDSEFEDRRSTVRDTIKRSVSPGDDTELATHDQRRQRQSFQICHGDINNSGADSGVNGSSILDEFVIPNKRQRMLFRHSYPCPGGRGLLSPPRPTQNS